MAPCAVPQHRPLIVAQYRRPERRRCIAIIANASSQSLSGSHQRPPYSGSAENHSQPMAPAIVRQEDPSVVLSPDVAIEFQASDTAADAKRVLDADFVAGGPVFEHD